MSTSLLQISSSFRPTKGALQQAHPAETVERVGQRADQRQQIGNGWPIEQRINIIGTPADFSGAERSDQLGELRHGCEREGR